MLEPFNCFDAETYADELTMDEPVEFREDQRSKHHFLLGEVVHSIFNTTNTVDSQPREMGPPVSLCESYR